MKLGTQVRNILNDVKFKKLVKIAAIATPALKRIVKKPNALNVLSASTDAFLQLSEEFAIYSYDFFRDGDWVPMYTVEFATTVYSVLKDFDVQTLKTSEKSTVVQTVTINGCTFGWLFNIVTNSVNSYDGIYVRLDGHEKAHETVKSLVWNKLNTKHLVARGVKKISVSGEAKSMHIEADELTQNKMSNFAVNISENVKTFNAMNENVSILLYGPAGTGKSTLARTVIDILGYKSIRIRVEDISSIGNQFLHNYIEIFEPDAVVFDDFDRVEEQELTLEMLEYLKKRVKVIIATVNDRTKLDKAILRPGRFDEHILIDRLDDEVVKSVLGEYQSDFDEVKTWPIAYIEQYVKIHKFCDPSKVDSAIKALSDRRKKFSDLNKDDELM